MPGIFRSPPHSPEIDTAIIPTLQIQKPDTEVKNLAPNHTVSSPRKVTSGSQLLSGSETSEPKGLAAEPPALPPELPAGPSDGALWDMGMEPAVLLLFLSALKYLLGRSS